MRIVITGASGGIGQELTGHLAQKNQIFAISLREESLRNLKRKIQNITTYNADVADKNDVERVMAKIGSMDALINCAGILTPVGPFLENDLTEWKRTIEVNLLGTVNTCYYSLPLLLKSRRGKIINFSGGGSAYPRLYHSAYATSKAAVVRFTENLALEYPSLNINAIAPGPHKTKMWEKEKYDSEPENWGDMQRLKNFIDFLISSKSDKITGKFIHYKDEWEEMSKPLDNNIYTLRRIEK